MRTGLEREISTENLKFSVPEKSTDSSSGLGISLTISPTSGVRKDSTDVSLAIDAKSDYERWQGHFLELVTAGEYDQDKEDVHKFLKIISDTFKKDNSELVKSIKLIPDKNPFLKEEYKFSYDRFLLIKKTEDVDGTIFPFYSLFKSRFKEMTGCFNSENEKSLFTAISQDPPDVEKARSLLIDSKTNINSKSDSKDTPLISAIKAMRSLYPPGKYTSPLSPKNLKKFQNLRDIAIELAKQPDLDLGYQDATKDTALHYLVWYAKKYKDTSGDFLEIIKTILEYHGKNIRKISILLDIPNAIRPKREAEETVRGYLIKSKEGNSVADKTLSELFEPFLLDSFALKKSDILYPTSTTTSLSTIASSTTSVEESILYLEWKTRIFSELSHDDDRDFTYEFWNGILTAFESHNSALLSQIRINPNKEPFTVTSPDVSEPVPDDDYSRTTFYETFSTACSLLIHRKPHEIFDHIQKAENKQIFKLIEKQPDILKITHPKTNETPLNALIKKIKYLSDQKKDENEFLMNLAKQIIKDYSSNIAITVLDQTQHTVLENIFLYAQQAKNIKEYNFFLGIGKELLNSINSRAEIEFFLNKSKIKSIIFNYGSLNLPYANQLAYDMREKFTKFSEKFTPKMLWNAIEKSDFKAVDKFLTHNSEILNTMENKKSHHTPLMVVLKKIFDPKTIFSDLVNLEKIALMLIPSSNLYLRDINGDSVLHHLFYLAAIHSQNDCHLKIFQVIFKKILQAKSKSPEDIRRLFLLKDKDNHAKDAFKNPPKMPTGILHAKQKLNKKQEENIAFIKKFLLSFQPTHNIFMAIRDGDLNMVIECLESGQKDLTDYEFGSTPMIAVIAEMNNILQQRDRLKPDILMEKLSKLQAIALEIIKLNPNLSFQDWDGNTVFHRLFWYASRSAQNETESGIFLSIAEELKKYINPKRYTKLSTIKNNREENFADLHKRADTLPQKSVKQFLAKWKVEAENNKSLRSEIRSLLKDSITKEIFVDPYYIATSEHGQTFSYISLHSVLEEKESTLNPLNKKLFKRTDLLKNKSIEAILNVLNKTPSLSTDSDNQKIFSSLKNYIELWKESATYNFNLSLKDVVKVLESTRDSKKDYTKEEKAFNRITPEKTIYLFTWEEKLKKEILNKKISGSHIELFKEMIEIFKKRPDYSELIIDEDSPLLNLDFILQNMPDAKKFNGLDPKKREIAISETAYFRAFTKSCHMPEPVENLYEEDIPRVPEPRSTTTTTTTASSTPKAPTQHGAFFKLTPDIKMTLKDKYRCLRTAVDGLMGKTKDRYKDINNKLTTIRMWLIEKHSGEELEYDLLLRELKVVYALTGFISKAVNEFEFYKAETHSMDMESDYNFLASEIVFTDLESLKKLIDTKASLPPEKDLLCTQ